MKPKRTSYGVQFSLRMTDEMKRAVEEAAVKEGLTGVIWIRRAIQRELDREQFGTSGGDDAVDYTELDAHIERVIERKLKEKNDAKNNQ